ncbi:MULTISPECIES: universal stress protein [Methanobacterium]|jgi:nucleotide-binding universal stress UspA family protein|uniref:Universal stress protein n=1 Tax=Methanobacterium formicicum TaxID=2162 RepID=A0A090IB44_METFO|nr:MULTISPECIES: universal stress protein [Methanobacterium]AIS32583.1 universal stress protein UspA4 [Methanobacterium formicicum]KUK74358.1 MAG: UspA domain-containing protein [Methanobacterium sp. 42_16]MBF4474036.1 universal stress protein [Methanobacterium formicicum]MDD4810037.1 universal stress protein [Methanobacterium formicicum]MDG3546442.1 universal stress protein [Methanobacterium formicicum]
MILYKKILLPTDGSEYSEKAGEYAIWIADKSLSQIIVLNVVDTSYLRSLPQRDLELSLENEFQEEGNAAVQKFSQTLEKSQCEGKCSIPMVSMIKKGKPAQEIVKTIEEEGIDLVVIGASGKHGFNRLYPGSVTESVVRLASCPVLVVK